MNCPRCTTAMQLGKTAVESTTVGQIAALLDGPSYSVHRLAFRTSNEDEPDHVEQLDVSFYCPTCGTLVIEGRQPPGAGRAGYTLDHFRTQCLELLVHIKADPGYFKNEHLYEAVVTAEGYVRIIDALTAEERADPARIGDAERQRILAASQASPEDVTTLLNEFVKEQDRKYQWQQLGFAGEVGHFLRVQLPLLLGLAAAGGFYYLATVSPAALLVACFFGCYPLAMIAQVIATQILRRKRIEDETIGSGWPAFALLVLPPAISAAVLAAVFHGFGLETLVNLGAWVGCVTVALGLPALLLYLVPRLFSGGIPRGASLFE